MKWLAMDRSRVWIVTHVCNIERKAVPEMQASLQQKSHSLHATEVASSTERREAQGPF